MLKNRKSANCNEHQNRITEKSQCLRIYRISSSPALQFTGENFHHLRKKLDQLSTFLIGILTKVYQSEDLRSIASYLFWMYVEINGHW